MERKKRKWDVAAPTASAQAPAAGVLGRAGIGAGAGIPAQYTGFVTGQGPVEAKPPAAPPAPQLAPAPVVPIANIKPGQPLDQELISRAQAGAAAAMEKINRARTP